jgi:hypothetical protein
MRNKIYSFLAVAAMLAALGSFEPLSRKVRADDGNHLLGSYAAQFTGTVFVQLPCVNPPTNLCASPFNGPFYRNARVVFDGQGNFQTTTAVANFNGFIIGETFRGTSVANPDGTFKLTIPDLPVPFLPPGVPNVFSFDGVLADNGKMAKVVLSGVSVGGQPFPNIGSVIVGELVRQ